MNKGRRKSIDAVLELIGGLIGTIEEASSTADGIEADIESIKDEESDYAENMPENMKQGDKGYAAEEAVQNLEEAASEITNAKDRFDGILSGLGDIKSELEAMQAELENASGPAEAAKG